MEDDHRLVIGSWLDAVGTIFSAIGETRALAGKDDINLKLITIGEGLQAVGTLLIGTITTDDPLNFAGNWIDGTGAATSSLAAYLQDIGEGTEVDNNRLQVVGDAVQSMGASISSLADHLAGETEHAIGSGLQGLGAGLEAIGGTYDLKGKDGQLLSTIGAIIQAIGSNFSALVVTRDVMEE